MESKIKKVKSYRKYILSKAYNEADAYVISDMLDKMLMASAVNFGTWYSGMEIEKVRMAYLRYDTEVLNKV